MSKILSKIDAIKERERDFTAIATLAQALAQAHSKQSIVKLPRLPKLLHLVIRNADENSRDDTGSVNSIQVAMDIAVMAAGYGMETSCFKANDALHLQISEKKEKENG